MSQLTRNQTYLALILIRQVFRSWNRCVVDYMRLREQGYPLPHIYLQTDIVINTFELFEPNILQIQYFSHLCDILPIQLKQKKNIYAEIRRYSCRHLIFKKVVSLNIMILPIVFKCLDVLTLMPPDLSSIFSSYIGSGWVSLSQVAPYSVLPKS